MMDEQKDLTISLPLLITGVIIIIIIIIIIINIIIINIIIINIIIINIIIIFIFNNIYWQNLQRGVTWRVCLLLWLHCGLA